MFGRRTSQVASLDETAAITAVRSQPTAHIKAMRGPGRIQTKPQISERLEARLCTERRRPSSRLQPVCSYASKFDALDQSNRRRLYCLRRTIRAI